MIQNNVFLGLGSNVGDRNAYINKALEQIDNLPSTKLIQVSSIYESDPVGFLKQPDFLNMATQVSTSLPPHYLLEKLQKIESDLGRVREAHWGPRTIDIDILFWGDLTLKTDKLQIPHREAINRRFVLVPMSEIAPDFIVPTVSMSIVQLLDNMSSEQAVELYR